MPDCSSTFMQDWDYLLSFPSFWEGTAFLLLTQFVSDSLVIFLVNISALGLWPWVSPLFLLVSLCLLQHCLAFSIFNYIVWVYLFPHLLPLQSRLLRVHFLFKIKARRCRNSCFIFNDVKNIASIETFNNIQFRPKPVLYHYILIFLDINIFDDSFLS